MPVREPGDDNQEPLMSVNETFENMDNKSGKSGFGVDLSTVKKFAPLAVIAVILAVGYATGLQNYLSFDALSENKALIDGFVKDNFLLAMAAYLGIYILAVSVSFPGASFLTIAGGAIFGWAIGGTLTVIAATIGASIIFLIAKTSLGDYLAEKAGPRMAKLREGFQEDSFNYLLTIRLAPVVPFWVTNLAPALFGMALSRYALATFIGIIPGTYAYAFIGDQVGGAVEGSNLVTKVTLGLAALAAASVIPIVIKWVRRKKISN